MKRLLLVGLVIGSFILSACQSLRMVRGTGDMTEEIREVSGFKGVDLAGVGTIFIEQGDRESLRIEAEDNLMQFLETEVEGETLRISMRDGINVVPTQGIFYYVTVRDLEEVAVNGLGNVDITKLNTPRLTLNINGGGQVNIDELVSDHLDAGINGLGDLNLNGGQVGRQNISINGGGSYEASHMASDTAEISIEGVGSAEIWANEKLDVDISGGGSVLYSGKPQVTQSISGLGSVSAIEE